MRSGSRGGNGGVIGEAGPRCLAFACRRVARAGGSRAARARPAAPFQPGLAQCESCRVPPAPGRPSTAWLPIARRSSSSRNPRLPSTTRAIPIVLAPTTACKVRARDGARGSLRLAANCTDPRVEIKVALAQPVVVGAPSSAKSQPPDASDLLNDAQPAPANG